MPSESNSKNPQFSVIEESTQTAIREEELPSSEINDYQQVSQRSNENNDVDLESQGLFNHNLIFNKRTQSPLLRVFQGILTIFKKTTGILLFFSGCMLLIIAKLLLQRFVPERTFPLFQDDDLSFVLEAQRRRRQALQEQIQRRQNQRSLEDTQDSIPSTSSERQSPSNANFDFNSARNSERDSDSNNAISSLRRIGRPTTISLNRAISQDLEMRRRRRENIRNEIIRVLNMRNMARRNQRQIDRQILFDNLSITLNGLHNRDFTGDDYEFLSSLDSINFRNPNHEISSLLISQLPTYLFQKKQSPEKETEVESQESKMENEYKNYCSICLEKFDQDEKIKIMPCFHQFHSDCVDGWLARKTWCPVCKFDIAQNDLSSMIPGQD